MRIVSFIFLAIGILSISGLCSKYNDEDLDLLDFKDSPDGGGGLTFSCSGDPNAEIVGKWESNDVNCESNFSQKFHLSCGGKGYATNPPCVGQACQDELKWDFDYYISGGTCYMTYPPANQYECCGIPVPIGNQSGASFTYSVSGDILTTSFGTFNRVP